MEVGKQLQSHHSGIERMHLGLCARYLLSCNRTIVGLKGLVSSNAPALTNGCNRTIVGLKG